MKTAIILAAVGGFLGGVLVGFFGCVASQMFDWLVISKSTGSDAEN